MSVDANGNEIVDAGTGTGESVVAGGAGSPVTLKDDDLVEVVYKGEKVVKPWKEARNNIQMQEDYTRSKQAIATQAKELKELYDGLNARSLTIAEKEAALDRILGREQPPAKQSVSDDDVVTGKQVKEILAQQRAELETTFKTTLNEHSTRADQERMFQRWEDLTSDTVGALIKSSPVLKRVPQLSLVLKREALNDKPQTEEEMKQAIVKAGERLAKGLDDEFTERQKEAVLRKKELVAKGPVPPGGGPQFTQPKKSYGSKSKVNFDELERDIMEAVEALEE